MRRGLATAATASVLALAGCSADEVEVSVSTTTAELVNYDVSTAEFFELPFAQQRRVVDSLLFQEETECEGELPETFYADVAARAFAAPRQTPLTEVVLQLCAEGYGTLAG
jgi:hypothetical protein